MHPPKPPRDLIAAIEAIAAQKGYIEAVDENYYQAFLDLTQQQVEKLAVAVMLEHEREVRRIAATQPTHEAVLAVTKLVQNVFVAISVGLARFDAFGRLGFVSRIGPEPFDVEMDEPLALRYDVIAPMIESIVRRTMPWLLSRAMSQGEFTL